MKTVVLDKGNFKGEYPVYERGIDKDIPVCRGDWTSLLKGDWIEDINGLVVECLKVIDSAPKLVIRAHLVSHAVTVYTCYGRYTVARYVAREFQGAKKVHSSFYYPIDFKKERKSFYSDRPAHAKLTEREKLFLVLLFTIGAEEAWKRVYVTKWETSKVNKVMRTIFRREDAKEYIMSELTDEIKKRGMDKPQWYLDKIQETLMEGVDSPTKLVLFKNLATFTNNAEINNLVNPEYTNQLPGGGRIPLPEGKRAEEASFTEVTETEELKV